MTQTSKDQHWRQKYFDALKHLELQEREATQFGEVMRRLVGRLCLAASGRDGRLDDELKQLCEAMRRQAQTTELEALLQSLSEAITKLDRDGGAVSREPNVSPDETMRAAIVTLLDRLAAVPEFGPQTVELREEARRADTNAALVAVLESAAQIILEQRVRLEREKLDIERLLQQVVSRLDEIAAHVSEESSEQEARESSAETLQTLVTIEIRELSTRAQQATQLSELREQVQSRLNSIGAHLIEFRAREAAMRKRYQERTNRLSARIAELERQSRSLHRSLQQEQRLAMIDALTGIPNRAAYDCRIQHEFRRWKRTGGDLCILAWDIDHFKAINDAYGHKAGDKVLRVVGQHLANSVRETDFVARYGGEEFVMILIGTDIEAARKLADKVRVEISQIGFHFHSTPVVVTASCGITSLLATDTPDTTFERADRALYEAKKAGRNQCAVA